MLELFDPIAGEVQLAGQWGGYVTRIIGFALALYSVYRAFTAKTRIHGARLEDRKIIASTYGQVINRLYGCDRMAGNVIWASEMREVREKHGGGKGGGGVETVTFRYFVDCAIAFCTSPTPDTTDVMRIWYDSDLVLSKQEPEDLASQQSIAAFTAAGTIIRLYTGSETQEPDPLLQAVLGIDNTPAFRGIVYIVFENLELTRYGRIPNVTAEICTNALDAFPVESGGTLIQNNALPLINVNKNAVFFVHNSVGEINIVKYDRDTGAIEEGSTLGYLTNAPPVGGVVDADGFVWHGIRHGILRIDPDTLFVSNFGLPELRCCLDETPQSVAPARVGAIAAVPQIGLKDALICYAGRFWYVFNTEYGVVTNYCQIDSTDPVRAAIHTRSGIVWGALWDGFTTTTRSIIFFQRFTSESLEKCALVISGSTDVEATVQQIRAVGTNLDGTELYVLGVKPGATSVARLVAYDISGSSPILARILDDTDIPNGSFRISIYGDGSQLMQSFGWPFFVATGGPLFTKIDLRTFAVLEQYDRTDFEPELPASLTILSTAYDLLYNSLFLIGQSGIAYRIFLDRSDRGTVLLKDVIADVSSLVKLTPDDVDVDSLTDVVRGTTFTQRAPAASHLEPLLAAYIVDAVESDFKVRYVKRGSVSHLDLPAFMQTIEQQYLGSNEEEGEDFTLERKIIQDRERPRRIDIRYPDFDQDFQEGNQSSVRSVLPDPTMFSIAESSSELPIVFIADEAKQVAESWLQLAWSETASLEFSVLPRFLLIDPTDVAIVQSPSGTDLVRVEEYDFGANLGVSVKAVPHVVPSSILGGAPALGFIPSIIPSVAASVTTTSEILDVVLLRDQDATTGGTGVYIALQTQATPWPGANVFISANNVNYLTLGSGTVSAVWGRTETALPEPDHFTVWDDVNTVDVFLPNGETLSSAADDLAVLNGANPAIIGKEVIQYRDATVDPGEPRRYTLSRLLRGRRGSNHFMDHPSGERFVVLDAVTILREGMQLSDINAIRYFKTVTFGGSLALAPVRALLYEANDLKPISPAHIRGDLDGSNNLTIRWLRRTRIGGDLGWSNPAVNGNVPLSEASERYEVEILSGPGGSVVRTINSGITISAAPATDEFNGRIVYSAADQTADGLTPGGPVTVRIYQMSEIVGRGFPAERTLS